MMNKNVQFPVSRQGGFSLLELMIAVSIVGILTMIAIPSYQNYLQSSKRSAAQADLMAFAGTMERHKAVSFSYAGAAEGGADIGNPAIFAHHSPASEPAANKQYDLSIESVSAAGTRYRLKATPVTGNDGSLYVYSDGRKAWDKNNDGNLASEEYCWRC
ncbi:MAG: type IV pilus assembly protein PilE [Paraglaciecola sp.]|jgi:type IV pilus assembly protein PilE